MTSLIDHLSPDEKRARLAALLRAADEAPADYAVSYGQAALMHLHDLAPGSVAYNTMWAAAVHGPLDAALLRRAFEFVVHRHWVLRSTFHWRNGEPRQTVRAQGDVAFSVVDAATWTAPALDLALLADAERPFDLARGPIVRLSVFFSGANEHVVLCSAHHVAVDYWSLVILMDELQILYGDLHEGRPDSLPALRRQYVHHALWQREFLAGPDGARLWERWRRILAGERPRLSLPIDKPRPAEQTFRGDSHGFALDAALIDQLRALARRQGTTLYAVCLAAFQVLLHRYTGETDILVGSPMAGRTSAESEGVIGYFANTIVLRTSCADNPPFTQYLTQVSDTVLDALDGQDYPFPLLVERLKVGREPSRAPVCDVLFSWDKPHYREQPAAAPPLRFEPRAVRQLGCTHDLAIIAFERPDGFAGVIQYSTDLFEPATIARLAGHYENLLRSIVADADQRIGGLRMLSADERRTILVDWNATRTDYPLDECVHELFEGCVAKTPDAVAVRSRDTVVTYRALDDRANAIADGLRARGVRRGTMVGVALHRSVDAIASLIGILKAGGAYVALDPLYPATRLAGAVRDVHAPLLITEAHLSAQLAELGAGILVLADIPQHAEPTAATPPPDRSAPGDPAYVVFTSGSTGTPKGVAVPHRGIVRLVRNTNYLTFGADDVLLHAAPLSFDASTLEIWAPLLNGGQVVLLEVETPSLEDIGRAVRDSHVTVLWLTTGLFHLMIDRRMEDLLGVRALITGGDVLSPGHAARARKALPGVRLLNAYGPTENTTFTSVHVVQDAPAAGGSVPIGRPVSNTTVYVLDDRMEPVPVGVPGELWTGGEGLAIGYVNAPELTAERFTPDPFSTIPGSRLYRTGDIVRYRPDGELEFVGRRDHQVKVRGFRVELGEVEDALRRHAGVRDCTVAVSDGLAETKRLVAYVVASDAAGPSVSSLRAVAAETLPEHAVPSQFVFLDALPLSPNGKVDRRRLPAPDTAPTGSDAAFREPASAAEAVIAGVWTQALGLTRVGRDDNFFDLGAHSLLVVRVHAELQRALDPQLSVVDLFRHSTVRALAAHVTSRESAAPPTASDSTRAHANRAAQARRLAAAKLRRGMQ